MVYGKIYLITNIKNNKIYIGQTTQFFNIRVKQYKHTHQHKNRKFSYIENAMLKYGFDNFKFEELCNCEDKEELDYMEKMLIFLFGSTNRNIGYNIELGGTSIGKVSIETRKKLSESHLGKKHSEETKRKISKSQSGKKSYMYGKKHNNETKKKLSKSHLGKTHSETTKKRMSEMRSGEKNPRYGQIVSEETRKKISESELGDKNPNSKLNQQIVDEIRANTAKLSRTELVKKIFKIYNINISYSAIYDIQTYRTWKTHKICD